MLERNDNLQVRIIAFMLFQERIIGREENAQSNAQHFPKDFFRPTKGKKLIGSLFLERLENFYSVFSRKNLNSHR